MTFRAPPCMLLELLETQPERCVFTDVTKHHNFSEQVINVSESGTLCIVWNRLKAAVSSLM